MSLALLVFVQHNVLLATSFKKLKGEWRKNSYIALTFMGSLLVGTCTVKKKKKKKKSEYARSWRY
jgi:general stress protein CsbA